jgi:ribosomal protein S25
MPQKKSLKQIEKQQSKKESGDKGGKVEKTIGALNIEDIDSNELMEQLRKMKAVTPTGLATHYNLKVSMAKRLLQQLEKDKVVDLVSRSHNLKVYVLTAD